MDLHDCPRQLELLQGTDVMGLYNLRNVISVDVHRNTESFDQKVMCFQFPPEYFTKQEPLIPKLCHKDQIHLIPDDPAQNRMAEYLIFDVGILLEVDQNLQGQRIGYRSGKLRKVEPGDGSHALAQAVERFCHQ